MRFIHDCRSKLAEPVDILPLIVFRFAFGSLMCLSTLRFMLNGWVRQVYILPEFHFTYPGFEWAQALEGDGMYVVFILLLILSVLIAVGLVYRISIALFFILFSYVELIDQAAYLNHYYFISLTSFLLIFLPANRYLSIDVLLRPRLKTRFAPRWTIAAIQFQLVIVYFFAGFAKLNSDWLLHGLPMKIWLKANTDFPLIGTFFDDDRVAIAFSWAGAIYDLTIPIWLLWRRTRLVAYMTVIVFHLMTALLFPIGMFPYVMIASTLIFFSGDDYRLLLSKIRRQAKLAARKPSHAASHLPRSGKVILILFFGFQIFMPLRHYLYPGDTNWTMEGYRFAWRVMLNEKAGFATFYIRDRTAGQQQILYGRDHLTEQQMRHMAYQPDMILEFAHYLASRHPFDPSHDIAVYAEVHVSHNGAASKLLIDPQRNLLNEARSLSPKSWILR